MTANPDSKKLMRYVVVLLVPLLAVLAGCSDEDSEEGTSAPSSPPTRSSRTAEPTQAPAPTQPQTMVILGGETGHKDAPPGVYVVDSVGANLRRIGDRLYNGPLEPNNDGLGQIVIDGAEYLTGVLGWAPDGKRLAFFTCPVAGGEGGQYLYAINADGTGLTRLSNPPAGRPVICQSDAPYSALSWAPDSAKLVYYSYDQPSGLYIVNVDGKDPRHLTAGYFPHWSSTGDTIAFVKEPNPAPGASWELPISAIGADGTGEREVAKVPRDCSAWGLLGCVAAHPVWSPRGDLLAFAAVSTPLEEAQLNEAPAHDVFVIKPDGSGLAILPSLPRNDPPGGGSVFSHWVDCDQPLPTPGCQVRVANVGSQRLNVRREPGQDKDVIAQVNADAVVCLLGTPALVSGLQWWPVRTPEGPEGWSAVFDPESPETRWLQPTGTPC